MKKKIIIILILAIIVSLGIGGTVGYFLHKEPKVEEKCKKEDKTKDEKPTDEPEKKPEVKKPDKDLEEDDGVESVGKVELMDKNDNDCGIGCTFTSEIYGARFFVNYRDTGTDGPLEAHIYDNITGEKITSIGDSSFVYNNKKIYTCSKEITAAIDINSDKPMDVKPSNQMKNYNDIGICKSVFQAENDKDVIIAAGIKDNKITFYNTKTNQYYYADRKIDKNINTGLTILEPYQYEGDYDARIGVGVGDGGTCLEYFYSAKDNSIKEFKTDCWGNEKE